jgi:serine protease Do
MRASTVMLGVLAAGVITTLAEAQVRVERAPRAMTRIYTDDDDRPVIGINTNSGGKRDTLGLLVTSVTPGGPADKAGIEEGNRIQSVNGVSLRLAAADAGEDDMDGVMTRRLVRELRKVNPGDEVTLRLYAEGRTKEVKVKTIEASELNASRRRAMRELVDDADERPVIGLTLGGGGSRRDTLGVLVVNVQEEGPAEKAGIEEGNRIASINGVSLRVSGEDAGDDLMANARRNRFSRELRKLKAGDNVELRVYAGGQWKTLTLKAARAEDVYKSSGKRRFFFSDGMSELLIPDFGVVAPVPPVPPVPPIPRVRSFQLDDERTMLERRELERAASAAAEALERVREPQEKALRRQLDAMEQQQRETTKQLRDAERRLRNTYAAQASQLLVPDEGWDGVATAAGSGESYTLSLPGLRVTKVDDDLAEYFGEGSEDGLLVLDASTPWTGVRPGDVLLSVNGKNVRARDGATLRFDSRRDNTVQVLRRGERKEVKIPRSR